MSEPYRYEEEFGPVTREYETAKDFITKLEDVDAPWGKRTHWIFRGQNVATWPLTPSLFRGWHDATYLDFERDLIEEFLRMLNLVEKPVPYGPKLVLQSTNTTKKLTQTNNSTGIRRDIEYDISDISYALAQHAGVPTRLLDFSYNPLVAAYFGADEMTNIQRMLCSAPSGGIMKYRFELDKPDDEISWHMQSIPPDHLRYIKHTIGEIYAARHMVVWAINQTHLNEVPIALLEHSYREIETLHAQEGCFLYDTGVILRDGWRPFEEMLLKFVNKETPSVYRLILPRSECMALLNELEKRLISNLFLYPSFDQVATSSTSTIRRRMTNRMRNSSEDDVD